MTEDEAQAWLDSHGWWTGAQGERLRSFAALLLEEADRQNLISAASRAELWSRHIVDSAQLLRLLAQDDGGLWVDLGTGAGPPGMVIACLRDAPMLMIEARPLRTAFLQRCIDTLGLRHARVVTDKTERVQLDAPAAIISARAYAPLDRLIGAAAHLSDPSTVWLLPQGRNAQNELAIAQSHWQGLFHVEQSLTDAGSAIVTLSQLAKRAPAPDPKAKSSGAQRRATWKKRHP